MSTISDFRVKHPEYEDMPDMELARALHRKFYSDVPFGTFARQIGMFDEEPIGPEPLLRQNKEGETSLQRFGRALGLSGRAMIKGAGDAVGVFSEPVREIQNQTIGRVFPSMRARPINEMTEGLVNTLGLPQPEGLVEDLVQGVSRLGAGAVASGPMLAPIAARLAPQPSVTAPRPISQPVSASAEASVGPGEGGAQAGLSGQLDASMRGGGSTFGSVGADPAAGLTRSQLAIERAGRGIGMRTTPGQATGSRALQQLEAKLESQPMTSGTFNAIKDANQKALNRAAARAIGSNADEVSSQVLDDAFDRLQQGFKSFADERVRPIEGEGFVSFLQGLLDDTRGLVNGITKHPLLEDLAKLASEGGGSGRQLQSLSSKVGRAANQQMTSPMGNRELGIALWKTKDYVDDLLQTGMSPLEQQAFSQLRNQYRNYSLLTSRTNVVNPSSGNVNGISLASVLQRSDKSGFLRGQNKSDMYTAARFAQAFKPIVGDSGTATRSMLTSPTDAVLSFPFRLASGAYVRTPPATARAIASAPSDATNAARSMISLPRSAPPYALPSISGLIGQRLLEEDQ